MKIIHTADWHYRPKDAERALASINDVWLTAQVEKADLVAFAGDMFDAAIYNSKASRLPELHEAVQRILDACPIVAVSGTPTHDIPGCYEIFERTQASYPFWTLQPGLPYFLAHRRLYFADQLQGITPQLLVMGCGEPTKEWFLRDKTGLGREEANQAVVEGMRGLLLGMGAERAKHPELPCLFVYHGQVVGASLANGQTLRPGGIQIGREDLALVGADYYALGDIHLAQQIGDLPAYYPGSAYPCNWGETDQKAFNLIRVPGVATSERGALIPGDRDITLERIPFPHPSRKKIVTERGEWGHHEISGFQVWHVVRDTPENLRDFDCDAWHDQLLAMGALDGTRVTTEVIHTETVRAGEIRELEHLREKVAFWGENSGAEIPASVLEKADELEDGARAAGVARVPMDLVANKLLLRGATGIAKGLGIDEVMLDLEQYDPGLIALVGPNGSGKTTLVENLHVWDDMLTRKCQKLQDHFCLRDSYRDLYLTEQLSGDRYRAYVQIDGANASGGCDYHLYRNDRPVVNGRQADYKQKVAERFGSIEMFRRSAFIGQKTNRTNPDLSDMPRGEKKAVFAELAGLEPIRWAAGSAGARAKTLEEQLVEAKREIDVLAEYERALPGREEDLRDAEAEVERLRAVREDAAESGRAHRIHYEEAKIRLEGHRDAERRIGELDARIMRLQAEAEEIRQKNAERRRLMEGQAYIEQGIGEYERLKAREERLNAEESQVLRRRAALAAEHAERVAAVRATRDQLQEKRQQEADEVSDLQTRKARLVADIDRLSERLYHQITCPNCGHQWVLGGEADEEARAEKQQIVLNIDCDLVRHEKHIAEIDELIAAQEDPEPPEAPVFEAAEELRDIALALGSYEIGQLREELSQAQQASVRIAEAEKRLGGIERESEDIDGALREAHTQLDEGAPAAFREAELALEQAREIFNRAASAVAAKEELVRELGRQVAGLREKVVLLADRRLQVARDEAQAAEWRLLERALGPDGVQALELDAMSPEIQATANRLLAVAREANPVTPFDRLRIDTTRLGGSGKNRRQIEDFLVYCHDTRDDSWIEISMLSGGESVWVREAIYEAFAVRRARASGLRFLTAVADEADGALDPEARVAYVRMLETAHAESGRRHTIVITQSEAVQQMIPQRIDMAELAAEGGQG